MHGWKFGYLDFCFKSLCSNVGDTRFHDRTSIVLGIVFKFTGAIDRARATGAARKKIWANEKLNFLMYVKRCTLKFLVQVQKYGCLRLSLQMPKCSWRFLVYTFFEWRRPGEGDQIMSPAAVRFRLVVDKTGIGVLTFTGDFDGQFGESKFRWGRQKEDRPSIFFEE